MNTTAGSSCPLLFSLQHTPNFFSAPPPLFSCLTCSSFCPVAEELVNEGGSRGEGMEVVVVLGPSGWTVLQDGWRMAAPRLLHMCNQHFRNMLFSSRGLPVVTSVSKPMCCSFFLLGFSRLLTPQSLLFVKGYPLPSLVTPLTHKTPPASETPPYQLRRAMPKQIKWMCTHCFCSIHHI